MDNNLFSELEKAKSVLSKVKDFGLRIRFVFAHDSFGNFGLEGKVAELSDERWLFRGQDSNVLIDRSKCKLEAVEGATTEGSAFTFLWRFKLERDNYFFVAGLEAIPEISQGLVN